MKNNVILHARKRVKRFFICELKTQTYVNDPTEDCVEFLFDCFATVHPPRQLIIAFFKQIISPSSRLYINDAAVFNGMKGIMRTALDALTWYRHVPHFIRIQRKLERYNSGHTNDQIKSFIVIPQYKWNSKHILIDDEGLIAILNNSRPTGQKLVRSDCERAWMDNFNFEVEVEI